MEKGTNTRFVVTTRTDGPKDLYEFYAKRGESENWIKDLKVHMKADRLSCHRFIANQFRLLVACRGLLADGHPQEEAVAAERGGCNSTLCGFCSSRSEAGSGNC